MSDGTGPSGLQECVLTYATAAGGISKTINFEMYAEAGKDRILYIIPATADVNSQAYPDLVLVGGTSCVFTIPNVATLHGVIKLMYAGSQLFDLWINKVGRASRAAAESMGLATK
jgi:hypothetical protein